MFEYYLQATVSNFIQKETFMCILRLALIMMLCVTMAQAAELVKEQDVVIYQDDHFYSAFPSIVKLPAGELLCAFRRAPERRSYG